ncbi:hypothetical protein OIE68_46115 [Nocardia vinacea]|uniref:hypothetical protein n=1 Tax=Nocardia vinacea TaxID=96468 RepID=UPI002E14B3B1|nr:hypothetical protein OIE68_46115 [Nocardia vinacea]
MTDSPTPITPTEPDRAPALAYLAGAPTAQGMVVPHITLAHRDRSRPVWGKLDPAILSETFRDRLCQICGQRLYDRVVIYIRPVDYLRGLAVEPGVHPQCGYYSRRVCPMLAGRTHRYNPNPGERFSRCDDPACRCAVWTVPERDPREPAREGQPAEAWYEAWMPLSDYIIVSDPGDDTTPPAIGVDLRNARLLKVRKIRDAAPNPDQPTDLLAALILGRALFGDPGEPR